MKLIRETIEEGLNMLTEGTGENQKVFIEGIFMQAEAKNRNNRIYEKRVLEPAVEKYMAEQVKTGRAVGELNHPDGPAINLDKVSHRITNLRWEGNSVVGKALILDTPMGNIVKGLIKGGVKLGVSSRGMGSVESKDGSSYVREDFMLSTVDIVQDPSAPDAYVDGIMEGVEWKFEDGVFVRSDLSELNNKENEINKATLEEQSFKDFLSNL